MWDDYPYVDTPYGGYPSLENVTTRFVIEETERIRTGILDSEGNEITMTQEKKFGFIHFA